MFWGDRPWLGIFFLDDNESNIFWDRDSLTLSLSYLRGIATPEYALIPTRTAYAPTPTCHGVFSILSTCGHLRTAWLALL